ncbi:collagen-like triple helix repeat-containing protein [Mediterraneibacter sp.]
MAVKQIDLGEVVGPKGDTGPKGETGPVGPAGPQGPAGKVDTNTQVAFEVAKARENIASNEKMGTMLGKIAKYFADLGAAAFGKIANNLTTRSAGEYVLDAYQGKVLDEKKLDASDVVNDLTTTEEGYALDARQGKVLDEKITDHVNKNSLKKYNLTDAHIQSFYTVGAFLMYKKGNEVHLNMSITPKSGTVLNANNLYGINQTALPKELWPADTTHIQCVGCGQNWDSACAVMAYIDAKGIIYFSTPATKTFYKFHGTWIVEE